MRQKTPWGAPSTNPAAFGTGADDQTFGTSARMPGVASDQVYLGDAAEDTGPSQGISDETIAAGAFNPSYTAVATSVGLAATGGALVGWLATGGRGWKGAAIGAGTNAALTYAGLAVAGRNRTSRGMMMAFGVLGLACAGGVGYLFLQQRGKRK